MPTRVLWLTKGLGPGGAERLLVEVARRLDPDRFDLTSAYVLPWKDHLTDQLESAGVRTICLSRRDPDVAWPLHLRQLLTADDGGRFDVVHAHSPLPAAAARLLARTVPADRRPRTISTEHNTWDSHHPVTRWANRLTGRLDAATFAVTEEVRASMTGSTAARAEVLVHGIDIAAVGERPPAVRTAMRGSLGIDPDEFVIGTVANLRPQKDYPRDDGVGLVFNTPNDQSRPGYLAMGWRVIGRLPVAVRPTSPARLMTIVRSRVAADRWSIPIDIGEEVAAWLERVAPEDRPRADHGNNTAATDRTLRTDLDDHVLGWRYGLHALHYRVVHDEHASIVVRLRQRGSASELVVADQFGSATRADRLAGRTARELDATYALRLGAADPRHGFLPLPNAGPILTWRALADHGPPPLPNWKLRLGDVELF